jgi:hypothetical protein
MIETSAMVVDTTAMQHTETVWITFTSEKILILSFITDTILLKRGLVISSKKKEKRKEKEEVACSNCIQMLSSFWYLKYVFSWKWQATVCLDLPSSDASCTNCSSETANQPMPFKKHFFYAFIYVLGMINLIGAFGSLYFKSPLTLMLFVLCF